MTVCSYFYLNTMKIAFHLHHTVAHHLLPAVFFIIISWTARFWETDAFDVTCVLVFSIIFIWNFSQSTKNSTTHSRKGTYVFLSSIRYFLSYFKQRSIFSTYFKEILQYKISQKIRPWGTDMWNEEGRRDMLTDMTKLTVAFRKFGNAPRMLKILTIILPHAARVCNL